MPGEWLDYRIERQRHEGFLGREALLAELDRLLVEDHTDRWVVVTGGPGMGKSAILTAWLARREAAGAVVPHHFIRRGFYGWDEPTTIVRSLAAQLEACYPVLRDPEARPESRLVDLLGRISDGELVPHGSHLVLLIDGLDEYDAPVGTFDPLAEFLPHALPRGVRLLCASRPRHPYLDALGTRDGVLTRLDLDDPAAADENAATVRAFWRREVAPLGLDDRFVEEAIVRAGGNLQHAAMLRNHLASVPAAQRRVEAVPRGLRSLLTILWQRLASDPVAVRGLGILCAAREPLSLDELGAVAGWTAPCCGKRSCGPRASSWSRPCVGTGWLRRMGWSVDDLGRRLRLPAGATKFARVRHALCRESPALLRDFVGHSKGVNACVVTPDGRHAVSASHDRTLKVWNLVTGHLVTTLVGHSDWVNGCAVTLDGRYVISASHDRTLKVWDLETGRNITTLVGHTEGMSSCVVAPDRHRVISASHDRTLKVWEFETGRAIATLEGHTGWVNSCSVTPDGCYVVSASYDRTLKVWDLETYQCLATHRGDTSFTAVAATTTTICAGDAAGTCGSSTGRPR
jgi:hypothetical protein